MSTPDNRHNDDEQAIAAWLDSAIDGGEPDVHELPEHQRRRARSALATLRAAQSISPAGDLEEANARIAAHFGFDQPAWLNIDGRKVGARRQKLGLGLSELRAQLNAAGEDVTSNELLNWQGTPSVPIARHTATCLAAILGVGVSSLASAAPLTERQAAFTAYLDSAEFGAQVDEWATEHGAAAADVRRRVEREMFALAARAEDITSDHVRTIVAAILDGMSG